MTRCLRLVTVLCLLTATSSTFAQTVLGPKGPVNPEHKPTGRQVDEPYVNRLIVTPAPEPEPPLKYSLYPRWDQLKPGNSVPMWYRALVQTAGNSPYMQPLNDNYDRWFVEPLVEMPVDEVRPFLESRASSLKHAREAAFREKTDWDIGLRNLRGADTIEIPLGEFQESRGLARLLSLQTRLDLYDRDFDAALADMAIALRLAYDVAEPETFINDLIGIAIAAITMDNVRLLIDTPGSPNLYWALAELPDPLIDMRPATQMEMTLPERFFPWMKDPAGSKRTAGQWRGLLLETLRELGRHYESPLMPGSEASALASDLALLILTLRGYPTAHRDLIDHGYPPEAVDAMPVGKVVAVHQRLVYDKLWQSYAAAMLLPYQQAQRRFDRLDIEMRDRGYIRPGLSRETLPIASALLPSLPQVQKAQMRRQTMRAALMAVEAIRMHLAVSGGRLPQSLDEITIVPVPDDPRTNAPFDYELRDDVAILDLPLHGYHRRFEIRVDDRATE